MSLQPYQAQSNGLVHTQPVTQQRTSQVQDLAEWAQAAQAAYEVSQSLVQTSFVPEGFRNKPFEATAAILAGSEVGLSPMAALRAFDVIQGTAAARALTLRAIVQSKGHEVWIEESTDSRAVVVGRRAGSTREQRSVWTIDRARGLGLTGKHNWKAQPQAMLIARATSEVCRLVAADAILGLPYSAEEISDGAVPSEELAVAGIAPATEQAAPRKTARRRTTPAAAAPKPAEVADVEGPPLPSDDEYTEPEPVAEPAEEKPTPAMNRKMHALFREADITERDDRLRLTGIVIGRDISTSNGLTHAEASSLIDQLEKWNEDGHLADHVAAILDDEDGDQ